MLQPHSWLWHYLWVAPNVLLLALGLVMWKRGLGKHYPAFMAFAFLGALSEIAVYTADVAPRISAQAFWYTFWASLVIEGPLKFILIGEIFAQVCGAYPSLARFARLLIRVLAVVLVLAAAIAAALAPNDSRFTIISNAHLLEQTTYLVESGLLVFIFLFAGYFKLRFARSVLGIALGLSISACVHLATWSLLANGGLTDQKRGLLDFVNMATYHGCVLIWFYYLLISPKDKTALSPSATGSNFANKDLDAWNRELERFVHS